MLSEDLKLNKSDFGRIIKFEITQEEFMYVKELLGYEIVYQTRGIISDERIDLDNKTAQVVSVFDTYRILDTQIQDFITGMENQAMNSEPGTKIRNLIVVNKNVGKFYKILCTETVKMKLSDQMLELKAKLNDGLLAKLTDAIENSMDLKEFNTEQSNSRLFPPPVSKVAAAKSENTVTPNYFHKGYA
jgi:hypothetical protein